MNWKEFIWDTFELVVIIIGVFYFLPFLTEHWEEDWLHRVPLVLPWIYGVRAFLRWVKDSPNRLNEGLVPELDRIDEMAREGEAMLKEKQLKKGDNS